MRNVFKDLPQDQDREVFTEMLRTDQLRVERIVSSGQSSPEQGWYDQAENEWVLVLSGSATLEIDKKGAVHMTAGDYLHIPAHHKHRVTHTSTDEVTIWLAIFYRGEPARHV